jgi:hypothetical protein
VVFVHDNGAYGAKLYPERMGSGVALFDANGDGNLDLLLVNGEPLPGHTKPNPHPSCFYLGRGDGTFEDRTPTAGLDQLGYGMGVAVGDVDNDGDEDVFVSRLGGGSLYLNDGQGVFTNATQASGLALAGYCTSAAFLDYDADGSLDLYVCRYIPWEGLKDEKPCVDASGRREYCSVHAYGGMEHRLFRGHGDGKFDDATGTAGIAGKQARGLAVVCGDYDQDGDTDILVANDETPNFLWQNNGKGGFDERGVLAGFAYNERGVSTAGMGLDLADVDGDGSFDVIESDFQNTRKTLYVNDGHGFLTPNADNKGLGDMTLQRLGFGIGFLDYDLDGHADIFIANGHVNEEESGIGAIGALAQTAQLFHNPGDARFTDASKELGAYGATAYVGRGAAFGDLDNDGDTDIVVSNNGQAPVVLLNQRRHTGHWIGLRLIGSRSSRSGLNAVVHLEAGKIKSVDESRAASSYLSSSDPRLVFGLGPERAVDKVRIRWPSGATQELGGLAVDRYHTITEGSGGGQ